MTTEDNDSKARRSKDTSAGEGGCRINIQIASEGRSSASTTASSPPPAGEPCPPPLPSDDHTCPPTATGACVRSVARREAEAEPAAQAGEAAGQYARTEPLAASFFHLARRFLAARRRRTSWSSAPSRR
jgi:hypothetical protein